MGRDAPARDIFFNMNLIVIHPINYREPGSPKNMTDPRKTNVDEIT